jgi:hypothetical protein
MERQWEGYKCQENEEEDISHYWRILEIGRGRTRAHSVENSLKEAMDMT